MIKQLNKTHIDFEEAQRLKSLWLKLCLSSLQASELLPESSKNAQYAHVAKYLNYVSKKCGDGHDK